MAQYKGTNSEADRAMQLAKKRELQQEEVESQKKKIQEQMKFQNIDNKFAKSWKVPQDDSSTKCFGLFTLNEMKIQQELDKTRKLEQMRINEESKVKSRKKLDQQNKVHKLSFDLNDDYDETEDFHKSCKKKIRKNPEVDTSFLRDIEREEIEYKIKEGLKKEWIEKQNAIKNENIEVTASYYDGSGHRFSITMKKGSTISEFLQACLENYLRKEFAELRKVTNDQLMYIKEDLILPYHYTFYDFIITKARGKSGPLFQFDVQDDIRMINDASIEKNESHAGKIVLRSWYERNKHIFPASRWEPYDPSKKYDVYTVKDKKV